MLTIVLTMAVLAAGGAKAETLTEPGEGFLAQKHPELGDDYYVVRKGQSNQCSIATGKWEKKPVGALGDAPYASEKYAKAALKTFPECKGGEADEEADGWTHEETDE
jgi:hypothetical protein